MRAEPNLQDAAPDPGQRLPWKESDLSGTVHGRFERVADAFPNRSAVTGPGGRLSYAALNAWANRLAMAILDRLGPAPEPVGLLLAHDLPLIAAILAVLKAGKFYVPLDAGMPAARRGIIAAEAGLRLLLVGGEVPEPAPSPIDSLFVENPGAAAGLPAENPGLQIGPDAYLNLVYTSGTTARPKGVLQTHRNVLFDTRASADLLAVSPADRFALAVPATFGASVSDIFGALLNGGAVCLFDLKEEGVARLAAWLSTEAITVYHSVPTVFRRMLQEADPAAAFPAMRLVKLGGELLFRRDFELFRSRFPAGCTLRNSLGTTETYMAAMLLLDRDSVVDGETVPVGYAVEGRDILLLGEDGSPVPDGEPGQIAVRSRYLSPGYWRQPEWTAAAFLPAADGSGARIYLTGDLGRRNARGELEYLGRLDDMVKIRGFRVELAAVESALAALDPVREAVVSTQKLENGDLRLVAHIVPAPGTAPTQGDLRRLLAEKLDDAMIPSVFIFMDSLPLLPFGKVDRRSLPRPGSARPELSAPYAAPSGETQRRIAAIIAEVAEVERIGSEDDFFELGLDSLQVGQVAARLLAAFGVEVRLAELFEASTVASLAALVDARLPGDLSPEELEAILEELESLSEEEARRLLSDAG